LVCGAEETLVRSIISFLMYVIAVCLLGAFSFWLFLGLTNTPAGKIETLTTIQTQEQYEAVVINTNGSGLNVRAGPSTDFDVVGKTFNLRKLIVCDRESGWVKVRIKNHIGQSSSGKSTRTGWVSGDFAKDIEAKPGMFSFNCEGEALAIPKPNNKRVKLSLSNFARSLRLGTEKSPIFTNKLSAWSPLKLLLLGPALIIVALVCFLIGRRLRFAFKWGLRPRGDLHYEYSESHEPFVKLFGFLRYLTYGALIASFIAFIVIIPPKYEILQKGATKLKNTNGEIVTVDLAVEQKAFRLMRVFPLWPTSTRVIMLSQDRKTKWPLKPKVEASYKKKIKPGVLTPNWKLMIGWPEIAWLAFLWWLAMKCSNHRRDAKDFIHAINENSFKGFRDFLNCKEYKSVHTRTNFYRRKATSQIRSRLDKYIIFLEAVMNKSEDAPLKSWFLEMAKSITGEEPTNIEVSFTRKLEKETWRDKMTILHEGWKKIIGSADVASIETARTNEENIRRQLAYENVHNISEVVNPEFYQKLENAISSTLSSIFRYLFSDELIVFSDSKSAERLDVHYTVKSTQMLFSKRGSSKSEREKNHYAGVEFDWKIYAYKHTEKTGGTEVTTVPKNSFIPTIMNKEYVFSAMCVSSFGSLGKEFLNNIGLAGDVKIWAAAKQNGQSAAQAQNTMEEIIKEVTEDTIEQILEEHQQEINEFMSSLHAHFDTFASQLTNNIAGAGIDLGIDFG